MISLADLVERLGGAVRGLPKAAWPRIRDVHLDSRRVSEGDLFAALPGTRVDGARFVADAIGRGARAVLAPQPFPLDDGVARGLGVVQWIHPEARRAAGEAAALVHGEPARGMFVCAVTGTNGKTTVAHLVGHGLARASRRPAVLGTAGHRLAGGQTIPAAHTTPDAPEIQRLLARHRELGGDSVALEASSHALEQERLSGLDVSVAIFTNLSRDHLDYHGDLERYRAAKARLFERLSPSATAVIHADDASAEHMADAARRAGARVVTYSAGSRADLCASRLRTDLAGTYLSVSGMGISEEGLWLPLTGRHNVENALAALAAVLVSGASPSDALDGLATATPAPGRLERVPTGGRPFTVLVDYAHTEAALATVCGTLRDGLVSAGGDGRLIVVFGCGGDRDTGKRGPMGRAVNRLAHVAVVTSDNPRSEDPARILDEVCAGMEPRLAERIVEPDRSRAIARAVALARDGDVVLIAGKGHETTQVIGSRVVPFDDRAVALEALR